MVGEQDSRAAPTDDALRVGSRVRLELEPGAFTFRRGASGSKIDHAVVPCSDLYSWESVRTLHPPDATRASGAVVPLSDHAFVYHAIGRLEESYFSSEIGTERGGLEKCRELGGALVCSGAA